jgi:threonylcarbamoyladenosine tRNA methylthiotransferase MtaB
MKIYLDSVGCRLNQSEIEEFGRQFRIHGHQLTPNAVDADLAIINTCAVTSKASSVSRTKARKLGATTRKGVVLTGCWATIETEAAASLPNVHEVIANSGKDHLVETIIPDNSIESERGLIGREPLPGIRQRTRAFIKVQDGCDLRCSYCLTTIARGEGRSVSAHKIIDDIRYAERGGTQEIVLTGVHLGSWGRDLETKQSLKHLILMILDRTDIPRIRLSSLEPWDLDQDFFSLWQNPRLCRHLHLPLQSGSDRILRRMGRRTTSEEFAALVATARNQITDVAITTDVIVGFPGETEHDFELSRTFIESLNLAGGHVFTYSERAGTPALRLGGEIAPRIRKQRSSIMRALIRMSSEQFLQSQLGTEAFVLWESISGATPKGFFLKGWTDNYIRVDCISKRQLSNKITPVTLKTFNPENRSITVDPLI